MFGLRHKGDFSRTTAFLENAKRKLYLKVLDKYAREGVAALMSATPVNTGVTASSWYYKITTNANSSKISFCNSNIQNGVPIAIILQYGHGTGTGGWVEGRDYINPAIQPVFDGLVNKAWEEVTKL